MDHYRKNHSKYLIRYHIIFACKYRKKLLITYGGQIKEIFNEISSKYDFTIEEMEVDKNHVHLLIRSQPKISPLSIVRVLKQQSTSQIWKVYEVELKKQFWKERTFWSNGYFCTSIGNASVETIQNYIRSQG